LLLIPYVHAGEEAIRQNIVPERAILVLPVDEQGVPSALVGVLLDILSR